MITPDEINEMIEEAVTHLVDDNPEYGAESLVELAYIFAKAGMPKESFNNIRQHIVKMAVEKTGDPGFIKMKLECAEKTLQEKRTTIIH